MTIGCANITRGSEQQIMVNAYDTKTGAIVPCDCVLSNDDGTVRTKSNRVVMVHRDKDYLTVDCQNEELVGRAKVKGKVNAGFWAADFFGIDLCLMSCWVDGLSGAWAEYPSMIDVPLEPKK
jgi:hypothetical protein